MTVRLASPGPAAEQVRHGPWIPLRPCDATASGAEDAQVRLARGQAVLDFCGHHADLYGLVLIAAGWRVTYDNRGS